MSCPLLFVGTEKSYWLFSIEELAEGAVVAMPEVLLPRLAFVLLFKEVLVTSCPELVQPERRKTARIINPKAAARGRKSMQAYWCKGFINSF